MSCRLRRASRRRCCCAKLVQEALACEAEIDRTYPSLIERRRRHPTLTMLLRLSRALVVEPAELVTRTVRPLRERGMAANRVARKCAVRARRDVHAMLQ